MQIHIKIEGEKEYTIKRKEIILLGETYFQITPLMDKRLEIFEIGLNKKATDTTKFIFTSDQEVVTIGRDNKCSIPFLKDKSFSKIQATITFDTNTNMWKIRDGSIHKSSTNGCWIYTYHSFEINDTITFQYGKSKFHLTLIIRSPQKKNNTIEEIPEFNLNKTKSNLTLTYPDGIEAYYAKRPVCEPISNVSGSPKKLKLTYPNGIAEYYSKK